MCAEAVTLCASCNFRKASRVVTQLFDRALEPSGLRTTQLSILLEIVLNDASSFAELARRLALDPSTLTRNLRPLAREGLIESGRSKSARAKTARLTPRGKAALRKALPLWEEVQQEFVGLVGARRWDTMATELSKVVEIVQEAD